MLAGILVFTMMFAIMKKMVGELPIFVVVLMRNLTSLAIMSIWASGPNSLMAIFRVPAEALGSRSPPHRNFQIPSNPIG